MSGQLSADDRRTVEDALEEVAGLVGRSRPDDSVDLALMPLRLRAPAGRAMCCLSVEVWGETEFGDHDVIADYLLELEVPIIDHDGRRHTESHGAMVVIWRDLVVPWLRRHGVDVRRDRTRGDGLDVEGDPLPSVAYDDIDARVEFSRQDWSESDPR